MASSQSPLFASAFTISSDDASSALLNADPSLPDTRRLTTRRQFHRKLLALSQQNEDLETQLHLARRSCTQNQEKLKMQEALIREMETSVIGRNDGILSCNDQQLLLEKTRQVAELSVKLETLVDRCSHRSHEEDKEETTCTVAETNTTLSIFSTSGQTSTSKETDNTKQSEMTNDRSIILEKENEEVRQKCQSLERSMATLKHKNAEREIRSAKNFRMMQQQMDSVQGDRNRRIEAQRTLEEHVARLEDDNCSKDVEILNLRAQVEQLRLSQRTPSSIFRCEDEIEKKIVPTSGDQENDLCNDKIGSFPPILVAASLDDDTTTASETDSQYDLSDEL